MMTLARTARFLIATSPLLFSLACTTPAADGDAETGSSSNDDSGSDESETQTPETGTETGDEQPTRGLPEGVSTWSGELEVGGIPFLAQATITNTGGDLEATLTFMDHPDQPAGFGEAEYSLTGTHEPGSGLVALAPGDWIMPPPVDVELVGFSGSYDPDTQILSGMIIDYASESDNSLQGGPAALSLVDGPGEPTTIGDGAASLADGNQTFTGEFQCTGPVRQVEGELTYDGQGGLTGNVVIGDPDLATPLGSFAVSGVHNPSTGGITLAPGLWSDPVPAILTFFVEGTYDPQTGAFDGDQRTNVAVCPPGQWHVSF
jgi:hypothetical protein